MGERERLVAAEADASRQLAEANRQLADAERQWAEACRQWVEACRVLREFNERRSREEG